MIDNTIFAVLFGSVMCNFAIDSHNNCFVIFSWYILNVYVLINVNIHVLVFRKMFDSVMTEGRSEYACICMTFLFTPPLWRHCKSYATEQIKRLFIQPWQKLLDRYAFLWKLISTNIQWWLFIANINNIGPVINLLFYDK